MELEKIKVDVDQAWEDEIALEIDGIQVKKHIPYEAKTLMASMLGQFLINENVEDEILSESNLYEVTLFVTFCIFYTNIDAELDTPDKWIALYDYCMRHDYVQKFYEASAYDLGVVIQMYQRLRDGRIAKYNREHSIMNKLYKLVEKTEDEATVSMGERILDLLEEKKMPASYLNFPVDLAKKHVE